jgi:hypothetical protein
VSLWLEDYQRRHADESEAETVRSFREFFAPGDVELHKSRDAWSGADVVVATDWLTVAPALLLGGASARAYLVQDHEPDFYSASAEALWAAQTYGRGLHCIAASRWLAELLRTRYGASASHFDLGVDHDTYGARAFPRRDDLVVFYARAVTARRAVPLGLLALSELARRRPALDIVLYGDPLPPGAPFAHRHLGVLDSASLAQLYSQATVGMALRPLPSAREAARRCRRPQRQIPARTGADDRAHLAAGDAPGTGRITHSVVAVGRRR